MLEISNLSVSFKNGKNRLVAVDGIDLTIEKGEILGLVGESGCGKTVTSMSVLKLLPDSAAINGDILLNNESIINKTEPELRKVRGSKIAMIFQNPVASLNPVFTIGTQMVDVIMLHRNLSKSDAIEEAVRLLEIVKIPDARSRLGSYPHEFSGGMCQRIMIAMAVSSRPEVLIADEPTAALDVTIQAQIIELLKELRDEFGMSILMISHDLGVISNMCDRLSIMYLGRIVESADTTKVFTSTKHPYTRALLDSVPVPSPGQNKKLFVLKGDVPSPVNLPKGCRFAGRCKYKKDICDKEYPELTEKAPDHFCACHFPL